MHYIKVRYNGCMPYKDPEARRAAARAYRAKNAEKINQRKRERYSARTEEDRARQQEYERDYRTKNADRINEQRRDRYAETPERHQAWNKKWVERNPERVKEYYDEWYLVNRERIAEKNATPEAKARIAEKNREYRKKNPEKIRDANRRRRALKLGADHVPYTTQEVLDRYGEDCHWCGKTTDRNAPRHNSGLPGWELSLHIDHVIELINGGSDTIENVRPACAKCNLNRPWKR